MVSLQTPESPQTINPELQYRHDILRYQNRILDDLEKSQQHLKTSAWSKALRWAREKLINDALESIEEFRPVSSHAQIVQLADFVRSLEQNRKL